MSDLEFNRGRTRARQYRAALRRQQILRAALESFDELGFAGSTIGDICRRAGASTGSVYHQFRGKEDLAAALYVEGVTQYQHGLLRELSARARARDGLFAVVRFHLGWVREHPSWARYLFQRRRAEVLDFTNEKLSALDRTFQGDVASWVGPHVKRGTLRRTPPDVFLSILLGPAQEFSRLYLNGTSPTDVDAAARELGRAAWRALSADQ